jgi:hypothetical protein
MALNSEVESIMGEVLAATTNGRTPEYVCATDQSDLHRPSR